MIRAPMGRCEFDVMRLPLLTHCVGSLLRSDTSGAGGKTDMPTRLCNQRQVESAVTEAWLAPKRQVRPQSAASFHSSSSLHGAKCGHDGVLFCRSSFR